MNTRFSFLARSLVALFVGFLFWSAGGVAGWRTLQMGPLAYPSYSAFERAAGQAVLPKRDWKKLAPAQQSAAAQKARVDLSRRLGEAVADPATINKADINAVKAAWGKDSSIMLTILQQSAQ